VTGAEDLGVKNLPAYLELVDKKLKSLVPENILGVDRLLQAHGKRLRPSLVILVASSCGKKIDDAVINAATAVELVHIASLVHDDIMDNGELRWGVPTINIKEGNDSALLAGDYLFAKGCVLAASVSAEAGGIMAETIAALCEGQARELKDQFNLERTVESLNLAIKGKTSSLFIAACKLGGLVAELCSADIAALSVFAENFGMAFQYMDDVEDFTKSLKEGKTATSDVRAGNYTLPMILSLHGPNKTALKELLKNHKASQEEVLEILEKDGSIMKVLTEAEAYKRKSLKYLSRLETQELENDIKVYFLSWLGR